MAWAERDRVLGGGVSTRACSEGRKRNPNLEEQSCSERSGKIRAWRALKISKADLLSLLGG